MSFSLRSRSLTKRNKGGIMIDSSKLKDAVLKEVKSMLAKEIAEWKQAVEQHQQNRRKSQGSKNRSVLASSSEVESALSSKG